MLVDSLSQQYQTHEVPIKYLEKWQQLADVIAEIFDIPAALIMRVEPEKISVLVASNSEGNPYKPDEKANLNTGLYCETVMFNRKALEVPHALEDSEWAENPDIALNMNFYLGYPLFWPNGEVFGTICVLDSKTRTFAEKYKKLLEQFKEMIESDFNVIYQNQRLEQAYKDLDSFAHTVSHDLKAPIHRTGGYLEIALSRRERIKDQETTDLIEKAYSNLLGIDKLISDILAFSRSGAKKISSTDVDLSELVRLSLEESAVSYPDSNVTFRLEKGIVINTDADLVRIVIDNLASNALKYSQLNENPTISFGKKPHQGKPVYYFEDNGIGFEQEHADEVFEPFTRLVDSQKFQGSGVGLATVKRIIERLGGTIWAESEKGKGTTFYFTLGQE